MRILAAPSLFLHAQQSCTLRSRPRGLHVKCCPRCPRACVRNASAECGGAALTPPRICSTRKAQHAWPARVSRKHTQPPCFGYCSSLETADDGVTFDMIPFQAPHPADSSSRHAWCVWLHSSLFLCPVLHDTEQALLRDGCQRRAKDLPAPPRGARWKRVMAASAGGVPEQLEQVRAAQVTHPAASSSAHEVPDNRHGARRAAGPCEVEWRRAWSSSATSPSRLGQSVLSVLHPRQFEGRCFAVRHPDPKCAHASAAPAASCARGSITHVVACLRPPACVAVGEGHAKTSMAARRMAKNDDGYTPQMQCTAGTPLHSLQLSHECG